MNIVFLDIDGVLALPQNRLSVVHDGITFDLVAVERLRHILRHTNSQIVVTSDWRLGRSVEDLKRLFYHYGLSKYILDKIPDRKAGEYFPREVEIKKYLKEIDFKISKYLVIDDIKFEKGIFKNVIKTELRKGLGGLDFVEISDAVVKMNKNKKP